MPTSNENGLIAARKSLPLAAQTWVNRAISKVKTARMRSSFEIGQVISGADGNYSIEIRNTAPEFAAFEFGSGLHSTRKPPAKYLIKSQSGKMLTFLMPEALNIEYAKVKPNPQTGRVFLPQVMHPGVKKEAAMEPALKDAAPEMVKIIGQQFSVEVIYKSIRDAFAVGGR